MGSSTSMTVEAKSQAEFDQILEDAGSELVVAHFWAPWAPMCEQMADVMDVLAKKYMKAKFIKVEAESVPEVSMRYEIAAVPTCVLLKNKTVVSRVDGANAPELTQKVEVQLSASAPPPPAPSAPKVDLDTRLKQLINSAPVMLFMKGEPGQPKCGFSRTIVGLLNDQGVSYKTFDILTDEEVRQGLKKLSDWPTYPQLYINGELVGGLDIVKEMIESGEFKDMLPKQESLEDKLKRLISQDKVMLFMKGNPNQPKCGFSKTTITILQEAGAKFSTFDILEDEEVRQGLKTYSDWPTYPQLYVDGQLIGGLDIIKELKESGDLESTLKGE